MLKLQKVKEEKKLLSLYQFYLFTRLFRPTLMLKKCNQIYTVQVNNMTLHK